MLTVALGKAGGTGHKNFDGGDDVEITVMKRNK